MASCHCVGHTAVTQRAHVYTFETVRTLLSHASVHSVSVKRIDRLRLLTDIPGSIFSAAHVKLKVGTEVEGDRDDSRRGVGERRYSDFGSELIIPCL